MVRTTLLATLVILVFAHLGYAEEAPLYIEKTDQLSEGGYDMAIWWSPIVLDDVLWLVYGELTSENEQILKYRTYDGEWSPPDVLADRGDFVAVIEDGETAIFFWNVSEHTESETVESTCFRRRHKEWDNPVCSDSESHAGDQFVVKTPDNEIWLLWSRIGFWEYQVFQQDHWNEKQVLLTTPEEYNRILDVVSLGEQVWIFYEKGRSDIYSRTVTHGQLSEPYPVATEGFPHLEGVTLAGHTVMVLLSVQEAETGQKTLAYTEYNGEWSPLQAVATAEDGYLAGGSLCSLEDGRLLVCWTGTNDVEEKPWKVDVYYRVYDGTWSGVYTLTDTPDQWETSPTMTTYKGQVVTIWREKESQVVYASCAFLGEGEQGEPEELQQISPEPEPEEPERHSPSRWLSVEEYIEKYVVLLPVAAVAVALAAVVYVRRKKEEEVEEFRIGERRKKERKKK